MMAGRRSLTILCADDDPDDRMLIADALSAGEVDDQVRFACDGEQLMDYLYRRGDFSEPASAPVPDLLLLDLNMPRMDGREVIQAVRRHPTLRRLPIVVLTTSNAVEDIERVYDLGANSYVVKPIAFASLVRILDDIRRYWFDIVERPPVVEA